MYVYIRNIIYTRIFIQRYIHTLHCVTFRSVPFGFPPFRYVCFRYATLRYVTSYYIHTHTCALFPRGIPGISESKQCQSTAFPCISFQFTVNPRQSFLSCRSRQFSSAFASAASCTVATWAEVPSCSILQPIKLLNWLWIWFPGCELCRFPSKIRPSPPSPMDSLRCHTPMAHPPILPRLCLKIWYLNTKWTNIIFPVQ